MNAEASRMSSSSFRVVVCIDQPTGLVGLLHEQAIAQSAGHDEVHRPAEHAHEVFAKIEVFGQPWSQFFGGLESDDEVNVAAARVEGARVGGGAEQFQARHAAAPARRS